MGSEPDVGRGAGHAQHVVSHVGQVMPKLDRVLETSLYVDDLERAARFYERGAGAHGAHQRSALPRL